MCYVLHCIFKAWSAITAVPWSLLSYCKCFLHKLHLVLFLMCPCCYSETPCYDNIGNLKSSCCNNFMLSAHHTQYPLSCVKHLSFHRQKKGCVYTLCKPVFRGCTLFLALSTKYCLGETLANKHLIGNVKVVSICNIGGSILAPWYNEGPPLLNAVLAWANAVKWTGVCFLVILPGAASPNIWL